MKKGNALQRVILFQAQVINTGQMNMKWEVISQSFYNNNLAVVFLETFDSSFYRTLW